MVMGKEWEIWVVMGEEWELWVVVECKMRIEGYMKETEG